MMGLKQRLLSAKLLALIPPAEEQVLSTLCDELASAGVSVALLLDGDEDDLRVLASSSAYDALTGVFGDEKLALACGCDVVVDQRFPVAKPHKFSLRGAACPSQDRAQEALDSDEVDFLIVPGDLTKFMAEAAPADAPDSKPWFAMTAGDDVTELLEIGAKRLALFSDGVKPKIAEKIWKEVSGAWDAKMQRLLFTLLSNG